MSGRGAREHQTVITPMFRKETRALPEEKQAVINYVKGNYPLNSMFLRQGYRRISYEMLDKNAVALGPSAVYRILKSAELLNRWNTKLKSSKGKGFHQPVILKRVQEDKRLAYGHKIC